jgi:phospholipid-binding lipoprotein MlaA
MPRLGVWVIAAWLVLLTGCATTSTAGAPKMGLHKSDPWENWNRKVYAFNDVVDEAVLTPVATAYTNVVPQPIRRGVTNFFGNVSDVWSAVNNLLQGKLANSMQDVIRVGTNTLFGLGGFLDVASEFGADRQAEDFGQTLGAWGMQPGPYLVWPLLGPSTLRDSLALPLDIQATPTLVITNEVGVWAVGTLQVVNQRANLLGATGMLNDIALDRYVFVRDAFLQRRRSLVFDGDPPEEIEPDEPLEPPAPAPSSPASAPNPAASQAKP